MDVVKGANLALRFGLELAALAALAYWGFRTGGNALVKALLGLGAPLAAAVLWGLFVSPNARLQAPLLLVLAVEFIVFASAVAALAAAGRPTWAWTLAVAVVLMEVGVAVFAQRAGGGSVGGGV
jgi:hypothetical protein